MPMVYRQHFFDEFGNHHNFSEKEVTRVFLK